MELLEREHQLRNLAQVWGKARNGAGRIALVSGEAGIGKTSLIERFVAERRRRPRVLRGACDDLFSPRPLGPFVEIAAQSQSTLVGLIQSGTGRLAFSTELFLYLQQTPHAIILILEDLHWADEATLDVVKFLGRRIQHTRTLLILSYRDDEVSGNHPLRFLLGDLPAPLTLRLSLPRLSPGAVERLERQSEWRPEGLYHATGGNPFFVTEILSSQEGIPPSVRDAVLLRVSKLSPPAQSVVELVSLSPGAAEEWLIEAILGSDPVALDECIARGALRPARNGIAFRHELARQAVEDSLLIGRSRDLHAQILAALLQREGEQVSLARLVHHAVRAGDEDTTLRLAPQAARQASALGAHREAISLYASVLRYRWGLSLETQARLLEDLSFENYLTGHIEEAIQLRQQAILIWQGLDRGDRVGDGHRWLSRLYWTAGNGVEAEKHVDRAVEILMSQPVGPELAMALSAKSQLHMLAWEEEAALEWGNRALELAEKLGVVEIKIHALTNIGSVDRFRDFRVGENEIKLALQLAREHEMHDHVGRCYSNLASSFIRAHQYSEGRRYVTEGLEYTAARDLDTYTIYLLGWQAQLELNMGHWAEAEAQALEAIRLAQEPSIILIPTLIALGRLKARRGDPANVKLLDDAYALALPTRELQRQGPVAAARAEAAWLRGDRDGIAAEAEFGYALAMSRNDPWLAGEVAIWRWRGGRGDDIPLERLAEPYAAMIRGDWAAAAEMWQRIGCPFERALALAAGDRAAQLRALALFEELGATAAAAQLRRQMQAQGVLTAAAAPRRPSLDELTPRELEVLRLIAAGLSNPAIAEQLTISVGTVKAHTGSIYSKLGVNNRVQALSRARELDILPGG